MRLYSLLLLLLLTAGCAYDNVQELAPPCNQQELITYSEHISPLLTSKCGSCHNSAVLQNGLDLENYDEVKRQADNGKLIGVVSHTPGFKQMPYNRAKLSDCDIALLRTWVEAGAIKN